jgi:GMP reductase
MRRALKLDFKDVLIVPRTSTIDSRRLVNLHTKYKFKYSRATWEGVPLVSSNMDSVTGISSHGVLEKRGWVSCFPKSMNYTWAMPSVNPPSNVDSYMISCGISDGELDVVDTLVSKLKDNGTPLKFLCVDVANGYLVKFLNTCATLRERYIDVTIVAGNVATPNAVENLILDGGVDIVKIGIGSGQACLTRKMAGVGYPQLSAVIECSAAAHSLGAHIISDGGITCPGDVAKAFCAGAHFVMVGSMLGAHSSTKIFRKKSMKETVANEKHNGGLRGYRASEGRVTMIPMRGPLDNTIGQIEGGLRSACTYVNAKNVVELAEYGEFVMVSRQLETELDMHTIGS